MTFLISHVISCVYVFKYVRSPNPNLMLIGIMEVEVITWLRKPVTWWVGAPQPNSPSCHCGYNIYFLRLNLRLRKHAVLQAGALNLVRHGDKIDAYRSCWRREIRYLTCHVTSGDRIVWQTCDKVSGSLSTKVTTVQVWYLLVLWKWRKFYVFILSHDITWLHDQSFVWSHGL